VVKQPDTSSGTALFKQLQHYTQHFSRSALLSAQTALSAIERKQHRSIIARYLHEASTRDTALDVQFAVYCMQSSLEESFSTDLEQFGVQRYLDFRSSIMAATGEVVKAARCQQRFFAELLAVQPRITTLQAQGVVRVLSSRVRFLGCLPQSAMYRPLRHNR